MTDEKDRDDWTCPACGETLEAQFDSCWKCDTTRKGSAAARRAAASGPPHDALARVKEGVQRYAARADRWVLGYWVGGISVFVGSLVMAASDASFGRSLAQSLLYFGFSVAVLSFARWLWLDGGKQS